MASLCIYSTLKISQLLEFSVFTVVINLLIFYVALARAVEVGVIFPFKQELAILVT